MSAAGIQRLVSTRPASITCFSRRIWSSVSRMVKLDCNPTSWAWRRNMRAQRAWNVPSHRPSAGEPRIAPTRSRISRRGLVGEGDGQHLVGKGAPGQEDMGESASSAPASCPFRPRRVPARDHPPFRRRHAALGLAG